MLEWITSKPIDALMIAAITVIGGSYLPLQKIIKTFLPGKSPPGVTPTPPGTDSHVALEKLVDVIHVVRSHGDIPTADALGDLIPQVLVACCTTHEEPDAT